MYILSFIIPMFLSVKKISYSVTSFAEAVDFRLWSNDKFGPVKYFRTKNKLLEYLVETVNKWSEIEIYEFGVAFGETAQKLNSTLDIKAKYFGYDTFEGLPTPWRRLPVGALTTYGEIPQIQNINFCFHKGLIQETLPLTFVDSDRPKVFIFDLDLFEPTLFAWNYISRYLNSGDILYFDEAFDKDERVILENYVLNNIKYSVLGISVLGLVLIVD